MVVRIKNFNEKSDFQRGEGGSENKSYSTDFCLSYLTNEISKGFDSDLLTGIILIDRQKAFDAVSVVLL